MPGAECKNHSHAPSLRESCTRIARDRSQHAFKPRPPLHEILVVRWIGSRSTAKSPNCISQRGAYLLDDVRPPAYANPIACDCREQRRFEMAQTIDRTKCVCVTDG